MLLPFQFRVVSVGETIDLNYFKHILQEEFDYSDDVMTISESSQGIGGACFHFKTKKTNGFTLVHSPTGFLADIFGLTIDGCIEDISLSMDISRSKSLLVSNHPLVHVRFSKSERVNVYDLCTRYVFDPMDQIMHPSILIDDFTSVSDDFFRDSFVFIKRFLQPSVVESISAMPIRFKRVGPADYRNFEICTGLEDLEALFLGSNFIKWLASITGLPLFLPKRPIYTRKLCSAGEYQILHGDYFEPEGLDLIFSFYLSDVDVDDYCWSENCRGRIHYLDDQGSELLEVVPVHNSATIVYRTGGAVRFTENVNGKSHQPLYQTIITYSVESE